MTPDQTQAAVRLHGCPVAARAQWNNRGEDGTYGEPVSVVGRIEFYTRPRPDSGASVVFTYVPLGQGTRRRVYLYWHEIVEVLA